MQEVHLSSTDATDLLECLDYSRMSTTPRRESESNSTSQLVTLSQLPSPFFEEFFNLLPLTYTRPLHNYPTNDDIFAGQAVFDSTSAFLPTCTSMPVYNSIPLRNHMSDPTELSSGRADMSISSIISSSLPPQGNSMVSPELPNNQPTKSASSISSASSQSYAISPGRKESFSYIPSSTSGGDIRFITMPQSGVAHPRRHERIHSTSMKRSWYDASA